MGAILTILSGLAIACCGYIIINILTSKSEEKSSTTVKILFTLIITGFVVLLIGWGFKTIISFFLVYPELVDFLMNETLLNIWEARGISLIVTVITVISFWNIFAYSLKLDKSKIIPYPIFRPNEKKRLIGIVILAVVYSGMFASIAYFQDDHVFSQEGKALKCYSYNTLGKIEYISCRYKVNPKTGYVVHKVTPEIMRQFNMQTAHIPDIDRFVPNVNTRYFDPMGNSFYWYYKHDDGKFEFFRMPGFHPQFNEELKPVSKDIAKIVTKYLRTGKGNMIIGYKVAKVYSPRQSSSEIKQSRVSKKKIPLEKSRKSMHNRKDVVASHESTIARNFEILQDINDSLKEITK